MTKKQFLGVLASSFFLLLVPLEARKLDLGSYIMFSCPEYAQHMQVECYIINREQLAKVVTTSMSPLTQLTNKELLNSSEIYLFVRIKNNGEYVPFGTLDCFVPGVKSPFPIEVVHMFGRREKFCQYALRLDPTVIDKNENKPDLTYDWGYLYRM
jgi:hypothetical protein